MWIEPITNRSYKDVLRANELEYKWKNHTITDDEKTEWLSNLLGRYTTNDINRVNQNINYLSTLLLELGYSQKVNVKIWENTEYFLKNDLINFIANIDIIRSTLPSFYTTPNICDDLRQGNSLLDYTDANDIENMLEDKKEIVENMIKSFIYSDEIYMGEF